MLRLATNEFPSGPFPAAVEAIAAHAASVGRYPEPDDALVARLAERHGLEPGAIALGNGGDGIIGYLATALLEPGDEVVSGWPSFPTYVGDARTAGAEPVLTPLTPDGAVDLHALQAAITPRTRLVWVCTPNNPTGATVDRAQLAAFLDAVPEQVLVVVDEAYHEFIEGPGAIDAIAEHVRARPNVGSLRTFSKMYGLAGLRIGWFAGPPEVAARLRAVRHYYDVTDLAILAALASVDDDAEVARRRADNRKRRARLEAGLDRLGIAHLPSETNFVCAVVDDAPAVAASLAEQGILVRSLDDLGRPDLLRITVGDEAAVDAVVAALTPRG
jgi:histidinol-phosphate aminotransferase